MLIPSLTDLSNEVLLSSLQKFRKREIENTAAIVLHLSEVDSRQLYRDEGFSSLHAYCTKGLDYSEGSAYRRIAAARALGDNPEIYQMLLEGKISLCAVSEIAKVITPENKTEVLALTQGVSKERAQRIAAGYEAPKTSKRGSVRAKKVVVSREAGLFTGQPTPTVEVEERFDVSFEMSSRGRELLERAKVYKGGGTISEILEAALEEYVGRREKRPLKTVRTAPVERTPEKDTVLKPSRYIRRSVREEVFERDGRQCSFVSREGRRCCERGRLQLDHIVPHAVGGRATVDNLRLRCAAHNQLAAEEYFGKDYIARVRSMKGRVSPPRWR